MSLDLSSVSQALTSSPFAYPFQLCLFSTLATYILSVVTSNVSQVDRLWTFLPTIYTAYFALTPLWPQKDGFSLLPFVPKSLDSQLSHDSATGNVVFSPKAVILLSLITTWMCRLSYNTFRRGLFSLTDEDYRWAVLRRQLSPALFQVVNLTFIAATQNVLLLGLGWPAYLAVTTHAEDSLGYKEIFLAAWALGILVVEFTSDNQQYLYQTYKYAFLDGLKEGKSEADAQSKAFSTASPASWPFASPTTITLSPASARRGFVTSGLWRYSRHPNFACEQTFWWVMCLLPVISELDIGMHNDNFALTMEHFLELFKRLLGPSFAFAPCIALTILFISSTAYTEDISRSKYPEAYSAYQRRVPMFGAVPLLGIFIILAPVLIPLSILLGQEETIGMIRSQVLTPVKTLLEFGKVSSLWWWLTTKETERNRVERLVWGDEKDEGKKKA